MFSKYYIIFQEDINDVSGDTTFVIFKTFLTFIKLLKFKFFKNFLLIMSMRKNKLQKKELHHHYVNAKRPIAALRC